ncbi:tol-pal system protein YbgF [Acidiferrobacter sp. SPIII_3]|uniref:tol-pal system protein YbgF n=1 Tax=Acidiferrobacter sp. SPIII_3 TaxID=1281578 RepID=UPI000D73196F|nr:tol-pal system protein YbgF [Acidiferrobacter sp. SPIII_3]AWP24260.1 tol-pal system protein YbgF [Acidiferrobacter sp. SPIII_3]
MGARSGVLWGTALALAGIIVVPAVAHDREPPIISIPTNGANPSSRAGLLSLLETLRGIREQLRSIENQVEIENHRISRLRQQQQAFFGHFDRRLRDLQAGKAAPGAPPSPPAVTAPQAVPGSGAAGGGAGIVVIPPDNNAAAAPPATGKGAPASASTAGSQPSTSAGSAVSSQHKPAKEMYNKAFNLLRTGRYRHAVAAFQAFLQAYPKDKRAAKAQYWVAETDYVERDYPHAEKAFKTLVTRYPKSRKVPNALLKMGYIAKWQGHPNKARTIWKALIAQYPKAMAAQVAHNSLTNLGTKGKK